MTAAICIAVVLILTLSPVIAMVVLLCRFVIGERNFETRARFVLAVHREHGWQGFAEFDPEGWERANASFGPHNQHREYMEEMKAERPLAYQPLW